MTEVKTLILTGKQVEKLLDMKDVIDAVEIAFRYKGLGKVQMPPKVYMDYPKGDLRTMPSYVEDLNISAVKIVNVHANNFSEHGMRTVMATLLLVDPSTGETAVPRDVGAGRGAKIDPRDGTAADEPTK